MKIYGGTFLKRIEILKIMNRYNLAELAIERTKGIDSISKIVLYGSVLEGTDSTNSDIDIAFILDDFSRGLPLDMDSIPLCLQEEISRCLKPLDRNFHAVFYYESYYERGI